MNTPPSRVPAARALLVAAALIPLPIALPAHAESERQVPVGARAIAMGGAFSAIADDGSALFWNPAGLARVGHQEIAASHADLFGAGVRDNLLSFVLPMSAGQALAAEWYHSGFDDDILGYGENRFGLAWSLRATPWLYAGTTLKFLNRDISQDGTSVTRRQGWGLDLGVLASWRSLRAGVVAQDLFDTHVRDADGFATIAYPWSLRLAAAYALERVGVVALDVDDRWHLGVESYPHRLVALRAGLQDDRQGGERASWSYGLGVKAGTLRFDWARQHDPVLDATDHLSLALEFNFNPAQIRIERVEARDIYVSQLKRYAREPFGTIQVRNLLDTPLPAQIAVFVPELMDEPSVQSLLLRPGAVHEVPLTAVFGDRALARDEDRTVQVQVRASYTSRRLVREDKAAARCVAYAPGAIQWGGGVEQAAVFVTTRDPAVDALARAASRIVTALEDVSFGNRNLAYAAAMTDALATLGVTYVPDPNNPYPAISATEHAVDTVRYPFQTLASRTGDCDDTTVLMAALLENVGVPTRLVDVPGHLALLVGTGVAETHRVGLGVDERLLVIADGQVWIPLETTAIARGFAAAWRTGAEAYAGWQARGRVQLVDVAAAQARYEPVVPPGRRETARLDEAALRERLRGDAGTIAQWRRDFMGARFGGVRDTTPGEAGEIQVAEVLLAAASLDEARQRLEALRAADSTSARVHNDLGVVAAAGGDLASAAGHLERALRHDPTDPGIWLNLGLIRWAGGDSARAAEPLRRGVALAGGLDAAAARLANADPAGRTPEEARLMLSEIVARLPALSRSVGNQGTGTVDRSPERRIRAGELRISAAPADVAREIGRLLYWRR